MHIERDNETEKKSSQLKEWDNETSTQTTQWTKKKTQWDKWYNNSQHKEWETLNNSAFKEYDAVRQRLKHTEMNVEQFTWKMDKDWTHWEKQLAIQWTKIEAH